MRFLFVYFQNLFFAANPWQYPCSTNQPWITSFPVQNWFANCDLDFLQHIVLNPFKFNPNTANIVNSFPLIYILYYLYSITVCSAAPQITLWRGPGPRSEHGPGGPEAGTTLPLDHHTSLIIIGFEYNKQTSHQRWAPALLFSSFIISIRAFQKGSFALHAITLSRYHAIFKKIIERLTGYRAICPIPLTTADYASIPSRLPLPMHTLEYGIKGGGGGLAGGRWSTTFGNREVFLLRFSVCRRFKA